MSLFTVVEFPEEKTVEVVRNDWIEDNEKMCRFPAKSKYTKVVNKLSSIDIVQKWPTYNINIIKANIESLQAAREYATKVSYYGDTENERKHLQDKELRRKHPMTVFEEDDSIKKKMKKLMQNDKSLITNQKESYIEEFAINEDMINNSNSNNVSSPVTFEEGFEEKIDSDGFQKMVECNEESNNMEYYSIDGVVNAVAPLIKMSEEQIKNHIDRKVHELFVKLSNPSNFSFSKMKSIDELKIMEEKLKSDERYKLNIISILKSACGSTKYHNKQHGAVSTYLESLFESSFLQEIRWSERSGVINENRCYLSNFPALISTMKIALSKVLSDGTLIEPSNESIGGSIKNYFKHHKN
ncbi:hypothetical protein PVAND_004181 [Polypedilum vanderplanki]|uniref:DUF4806 domain-containing protein n=1 Tax=Polypedilum vanderplanki TaxID=319348 RepID=A0A9J6BWC1_POLVA|nr:hypothetical protein PVAND_004181 [Polypedilum vanderplanki]